MKNDYYWLESQDGNVTTVQMFNGLKFSENYSKLPNKIIDSLADFFELTLYGEISMYNGKMVYKVGIKSSDTGGMINILTTKSKASRNKFICNYKKEITK